MGKHSGFVCVLYIITTAWIHTFYYLSIPFTIFTAIKTNQNKTLTLTFTKAPMTTSFSVFNFSNHIFCGLILKYMFFLNSCFLTSNFLYSSRFYPQFNFILNFFSLRISVLQCSLSPSVLPSFPTLLFPI